MGEDFRVRPFKETDWEFLFSWFKQKGWDNLNETIFKISADMKHVQTTVAVDQNDNPLSYLSVAFFKKFVFVGMYMTDPNFRGQGIGSMLWKSVMDKIGVDKNFYLISEPVMTEKYRRISGFTFTSPIRAFRYIGKIDANVLEPAIEKQKSGQIYSISSNLNESAIQKLIKYDSDVRDEDTSDFFKIWLSHSQVNSSNSNPCIFTVCATDEKNQMVGYGSIWLTKLGRRVGPLMADNFEIFLLILKELMNYKFIDANESNEELTFNIPSTNVDAVEFVKGMNLNLYGELDRSFTKNVVDIKFEKVFCFAWQIGVPE